ncbi:MAG TPA: ABC transporter ATP-binding protein [Dongiaceae bacterium]
MSASLDVEGVTVDFQGLRAIEKVSLSLAPGEILGLIGPNGAGKTTLVNVLTGFQAPTEGRVRLAGADITLWPAFKRSRAGLARTFQSVLLFKGLSVMENIEAGAVAVGLDREAARKRALDILEWLGLGAVGARVAGTLPFGSERRVGIGRAIAMRPAFLLMDEPAAGLNDSECTGLEQVIRRVREEIGCGILLIEHRMPLVFSLCDRIHVLEQGRSIAAGTPAAIRADPRVRQAYLGEEVS